MKLRTLTTIVRLSVLLVPGIANAASVLNPVPLGGFTSALYSYSLEIVGLAVFTMFLIAGLAQIIPAFQQYIGKQPMDIIKDAVIGLVILASAYVILNSISPDLVSGGPTPVP